MIITQIIKMIFIKKKIICEEMEESKKDIFLSRIGRVTALIIYSGLYVIKELYLKNTIVFDVSFVTSLLTGATGTLVLAKGIYTMFHQWSKKNNVFERLEYIEKLNMALEKEIDELEELQSEEPKKKWILTNKREEEKK